MVALQNNTIASDALQLALLNEALSTNKVLAKSEPIIKNEVSLEPIIPIIDMEKEEKKTYVKAYKKPRKVARKSSSKKFSKKIVHAKAGTYLTAKEMSVVNTSMDSINIKKINLKSSSINYIEAMKKKFKRGKQPREALLLSKAYYGKGDYSNAEQWALTANKLNAKLEESWLMFAKSKAKLGNKNEAIKILSAYYKKNKSAKAKALLIKIKMGKL